MHDIKTKLEQKKRQYMNNKQCYGFKLAKIYYSLQDLENDNYKEIAVDNDKLVYGSETNLVQLGDYCILKLSETSRRLYTRIKTGDSELWSLKTNKNLDKVLESSRNFFLQQAKNLEELDELFFKNNKCGYDETINQGDHIELIKLNIKYKEISSVQLVGDHLFESQFQVD